MKGHSGLTPQEEKIMDLRDQGKAPREIARCTGYRLATVQRTVGYYGAPLSEQAKAKRDMATASARLRDATLAFYAERQSRIERGGQRC